MAASSADVGYEPELLRAVESVNRRQKQVLFGKLSRYFGGQLRGKTIAVWGLAFKPNTDDMREASSRDLLEALWEVGARVRAYDPVAMEEAQRIFGQRADLKLCETAEGALETADALVIVTEWREFRSPDFEHIKKTLSTPVIFDGRNIYDPTLMKRFGIEYFGIGRGSPLAESQPRCESTSRSKSNGSLRTRVRVAANRAFATAGAATGTPSSPKPPGSSADAMNRISMSGVSSMRSKG